MRGCRGRRRRSLSERGRPAVGRLPDREPSNPLRCVRGCCHQGCERRRDSRNRSTRGPAAHVAAGGGAPRRQSRKVVCSAHPRPAAVVGQLNRPCPPEARVVMTLHKMLTSRRRYRPHERRRFKNWAEHNRGGSLSRPDRIQVIRKSKLTPHGPFWIYRTFATPSARAGVQFLGETTPAGPRRRFIARRTMGDLGKKDKLGAREGLADHVYAYAVDGRRCRRTPRRRREYGRETAQVQVPVSVESTEVAP